MAKTILTLTPVATPLRPSSGQSGRSSGGARLAVPRVACPYRRKWAECMPPTNISGLSQVVTGLTSSVPRMAVCSSLLCCTPPSLCLLALGKHPENVLHHAERVERATLSARFRKRPRYSFGACFRICTGIFVAFGGSAYRS